VAQVDDDAAGNGRQSDNGGDAAICRTARRRRHEEGSMNRSTSIAALGIVGLLLSACGGSGAAATQANGGGGGGTATDQPQATDEPQGTDAGGGGGGGGNDIGFGNGKATFEVSGPITASGEYGFVPYGSIFGGAQGSSLTFARTTGADASLLNIIVGQDGSVLVSYTGTEGQMPAAACTTSDWNIGATSGSGKFDCTAQFSITASGATVAGGTIKGSFEAHA
jgi:hypothetical protein